VPAERLDAMLTRNGELLVARRSVESWSDDVEALRDYVGGWRDEWRTATKPLGKLRRGAEGEAEADPLVRRLGQALDRAGDRLNELEDQLDRLAGKMARNRRQLARAADLLDEDVRRVRMLPFADACQGLERAARDLSQAAAKPVDLVIEGGAVELDRSVLEGLKDPLMHLVRNAIDHGIESAERRRAAGKPPVGRVSVTAELRGPQVEIVVADDGAGLDIDALRQQAKARGLSESADDRALADLIFQPGVSTSAIITNISGRGVGLDVVKSRVEALHGTIELTSEPGQGMRFTLDVPLTLTTLRAVLVKESGQFFAVASACVQRLVRIDPRDFRMVEGREMLLTRGSPPLPVASLSTSLGLVAPPELDRTDNKRPGLIVAVGDRRAAFIVDELLAEQEIVVKGLGARIRRARLVSGSTILPSGRIALVLNAVNLLRAALSSGAGLAASRAQDQPSSVAAVASRKRLLVVDDSVTTRTLEKTILEAAGYEVATAVDGEDGWRLLQERGADLLISDIEMPRMDGFALAETVRASSRFAELPVVLFSSRASETDKARGIEVGADAYIVKGAFDQKDLLETIAQLL
jgi:two-component system chemotaxis sensor kinase CheA